MTEKKVFDVKDINNKDGQYIFFNSIEDNFSPSANEISYCEKKIKSNTSGDISNLPNILKNPDKITKSQLVEFLIEYSYIIKKATIHLKKCIDEQSLYNSVGKKYCSSVGPKMGELYIPAEMALKKVAPIRLVDKTIPFFSSMTNSFSFACRKRHLRSCLKLSSP